MIILRGSKPGFGISPLNRQTQTGATNYLDRQQPIGRAIEPFLRINFLPTQLQLQL